MNKQSMNSLIYYLTLIGIVLFSFFHHSSLYSPFLNSDDAVVILMIHDFDFLKDLYYWNANRFGSFVPLVGQFFYRIMHLTPIQSESLTHFLLLIIGFLGFTSLFKSKYTKLIFAVVWFLPPLRMIDLLKLSQGEQYALIGIIVFLVNKLYSAPFSKYQFKQHAYLFLIILISVISVWVSDLALVSIGILSGVFVICYFRNNIRDRFKDTYKKPELYYILFGLIAGALFLNYAKANTAIVDNYYSFFNLELVLQSLKLFGRSVGDLFLFRINEPFTSLYMYLLILVLLLIIYNYRTVKKDLIYSRWVVIFILDFAMVFIIIISSKWAFINGVPRRYFVCNYVSFWIVFLMIVEHVKILRFRKMIFIILATTVLIGGLGTIYNFKYLSPKGLTPTVKVVGELKQLGKVGIISEYWNSYINAVADPDNIKATPNDQSMMYRQNLVDSVFTRDQIYVIRDMWMDSFPDTLEQFGYVLLKNGNEFQIARSKVCKYKIIPVTKTLELEKLSYKSKDIFHDKELDKEVLYIPSDCDLCKNKYAVFGPYMRMGIGTFKAKFRVKVVPKNDGVIALLDVSANSGQIQLASKEISGMDFVSNGAYEEIEIQFKNERGYNNVEFRIFYYGNADLYFDNIKVVEYYTE